MADTKISALTNRAAPASTDVVAVAASGVSYKVSFLNLIRSLVGMEKVSGTRNYALDAANNTVDSAASGAVILGIGGASFPNKIGILNGLPVGTDLDPGWAADSGYVSGGASASSIPAGYDCINNSSGSIVLSNHSMVSYSAAGHNTLLGGSYNWIAGSRSLISGARQSRILANATYCTILGGNDNEIGVDGDYGAIISGDHNTISSTANYNYIGASKLSEVGGTSNHAAIKAALSCTIDGLSDNSTIIAADSCTISGGSRSFIGGARNTDLTGDYSAAIACDDSESSKAYGLMVGAGIKQKSGSAISIGAVKLVSRGDAQGDVITLVKRTTNATLTNMSTGDGFIALDGTLDNAVAGTVVLTGMREDTGAACGYKLDFVATWDGTTYQINGSSSEASMTAIYNGAGVVTAPTVAGSGGSLRTKVTGLAAVNFKWCAVITMASVNA